MKPNETLDKDGSIFWDRPRLERFKRAYSHVKATGEVIGHEPETFTFDDHEFVPGYAKYLIEYLEGVL